MRKKVMRQIIRYSEQDFAEHPDKDRMIELAMMSEYNGVFDYEFTRNCYRKMLAYQQSKIRKEEEYDIKDIRKEVADKLLWKNTKSHI